MITLSKERKARVPHVCDCCNVKISKGDRYHIETGEYHGHFKNVMCLPCRAAMLCAIDYYIAVYPDSEGVEYFIGKNQTGVLVDQEGFKFTAEGKVFDSKGNEVEYD